MTTLDILAEGKGEYLKVDPDGFRDWVRENKSRALVPKLMSEKDAIEKFVQDGDYLLYECNYLQRGPASLIREVIRQKKTDLWLGAKFTWVAAALLVGGGCASKLDVGFFLFGPTVEQAIREGKVQAFEYSNVVMTNRLMAGAMGLPFFPVRSFGGTDGFTHSGAKLINDPDVYRAVDNLVIGVNESKLLRWLIRSRQKKGIKAQVRDEVDRLEEAGEPVPPFGDEHP